MAFVQLGPFTYSNQSQLLSGSKGANDVLVKVSGIEGFAYASSSLISGMSIGGGSRGRPSDDDPIISFDRPVPQVYVEIGWTDGFIDPGTSDYLLAPGSSLPGEEYAFWINGEKLNAAQLSEVVEHEGAFRDAASAGFVVNDDGHLVRYINLEQTGYLKFSQDIDGIETLKIDTIHTSGTSVGFNGSQSVVNVLVDTSPLPDITPPPGAILGTQASDLIEGTISDDEIYALLGNDRVAAGDGDDRVFGDRGNDTLIGNAGNDSLFGESGNDKLFGRDGKRPAGWRRRQGSPAKGKMGMIRCWVKVVLIT